MEGLGRFLKGRSKQRGANPKTIDECIYTPYNYSKPQRSDPIQSYERRHSTGGDPSGSEPDLIDLRNDSNDREYSNGHSENGFSAQNDAGQLQSEELLGPGPGGEERVAETIPDFDIAVHTPEVFLFDYGVVVIWGMSAAQEKRFLKEIAKFELEKLAADDVEVELFNFYYTREYQARIYNDFITLRDKNNYMTKLAISHALAQSVKVSTQPLPLKKYRLILKLRHPSSKNLSRPPSRPARTSPPKSQTPAKSHSPAPKSTCKLASSSFSASTSTSMAPSSIPPSCSGLSRSWNPCTRL
jgi:uncharacterized Rmd1/YagE family protein